MSDATLTELPEGAVPGVLEEDAAAPEAAAPPVVEGAPEVQAALDETAADAGEAPPEPKKVSFHDVELSLPDKLPRTILFDLTTVELAGEDPMPAFRLLQSLLGPEQFVAVRNQVAANDIDLGEVVGEGGLLSRALEQFGIGLGE